MPALCRAFAIEKPFPAEQPRQGTMAVPKPRKSQTLGSARDLVGCHGISSVNGASAAPKTGSAVHHLVTSSSVKKALMDQEDFAGGRTYQ
jgi:hypothetical protein